MPETHATPHGRVDHHKHYVGDHATSELKPFADDVEDVLRDPSSARVDKKERRKIEAFAQRYGFENFVLEDVLEDRSGLDDRITAVANLTPGATINRSIDMTRHEWVDQMVLEKFPPQAPLGQHASKHERDMHQAEESRLKQLRQQYTEILLTPDAQFDIMIDRWQQYNAIHIERGERRTNPKEVIKVYRSRADELTAKNRQLFEGIDALPERVQDELPAAMAEFGLMLTSASETAAYKAQRETLMKDGGLTQLQAERQIAHSMAGDFIEKRLGQALRMEYTLFYPDPQDVELATKQAIANMLEVFANRYVRSDYLQRNEALRRADIYRARYDTGRLAVRSILAGPEHADEVTAETSILRLIFEEARQIQGIRSLREQLPLGAYTSEPERLNDTPQDRLDRRVKLIFQIGRTLRAAWQAGAGQGLAMRASLLTAAGVRVSLDVARETALNDDRRTYQRKEKFRSDIEELRKRGIKTMNSITLGTLGLKLMLMQRAKQIGLRKRGGTNP